MQTIESYWDLEKDPIDIVYFWVDGNDKKWRDKRNLYYTKEHNIAEEANYECRFIDNDELKYSLRSLEKYAPWINNVYIITDEQIPQWLNTENEKVKLIYHKDLLPEEALPCFNSVALECFFSNIEGLSEHFLYANDDMYFADYITPEFFYAEDKYPICRFIRKIDKNNSEMNLYSKLIINAQNLIKNKLKKTYENLPHHNIDAYRKSDIIECIKTFNEDFCKTKISHFRADTNLERVIYSYYACAVGHGHFKKVSKISPELPLSTKIINFILRRYRKDSAYIYPHNRNFYKKIKQLKPKLFCINDNEDTKNEDRLAMKEFLNSYFSEKSTFEK